MVRFNCKHLTIINIIYIRLALAVKFLTHLIRERGDGMEID